MKDKEFNSYVEAGEIAKKVRNYIKEVVKPGMKLIDIAEKIEKKIEELGAKIAFPLNLSINDVAAHYHPTFESDEVASGLLKIDLGVHINGFIADTALSLDLTKDKKFKNLIESSEDAINNALELLKKNPDVEINKIGEKIQKVIEKKGFSPIINLSGHSLGEYSIHSGITIPNYNNKNENKLKDGAYAIEPFATDGDGKIYEGPNGNIYALIEFKNVRSIKAREILNYIVEEHKTLPFSLREIQKKFGNFARFALVELENLRVIKSYPQLIEKSHGNVSQAEHSFIKKGREIIVLTKD